MPKITGIRVMQIQANFPWTFIRVYSDADGGAYGTGECFLAPGVRNIIHELSELLLGEDPRRFTYLVERMRWAASGAGSMGGILWNAISGIETALIDLTGKLLSVPAVQLLGGKVIEKIPVYLDCHGGTHLERLDSLLQPIDPYPVQQSAEVEFDVTQEIEQSINAALNAVDEGYRILKFDLDIPGSRFDSAVGYRLSSAEKDWMVSLVSSLRDALGPNVDIAFDAHWRYSAADMLDVSRGIELYHPLWLEDPVPPHDIEGLRRMMNAGSTAIATGENLQLRQGFLPVIVDRLCDIVTPDIQKCGGMSEAVTIGRIADACNTRFAAHMIGSPIALAAATHVCSALPNAICCEFHGQSVPFYRDITRNDMSEWFGSGYSTVLDLPGLGVELDVKELQKHAQVSGDVFGE